GTKRLRPSGETARSTSPGRFVCKHSKRPRFVITFESRATTEMSIKRRDVLKLSGAALTGTLAGQTAGAKKKVIVIGAGIAGLSCGYELMRRGHDVTVLEASGRTGGHVRTLHDPL